jgi:hypothetical protein
MAGLLSRERTIAKPGFNRRLIPPCALATLLCIGQACALVPLTGKIGSIALFVACFCIILGMYGGGSADRRVPAWRGATAGSKEQRHDDSR